MKGCPELYEKYRIESEIGRGASGVCYRVQHALTKEIYAMKKIHISSMKKHNTKEIFSEVAILSKLKHNHIVKLLEFFSDQNHLYIIMQYAPKGDLHNLLKRRKIRKDSYSEKEIWEMARQLLSALQYLHGLNIVHRDVKTLNIFVDSAGKLYLGDLGVSKILKTESGLYSRVGTPLYLAPQIIKYQKYDYKADIWGLGCVCYQLATMTHPFQGKNIISLGQNIVSSQPKTIQNYSHELNDLIMQMLQKNPNKRPSACDLMKRYFKEGMPPVAPQKPLQTQPTSIKEIEKKEDKSPLFLKSNQIHRKAVNNYIEQRIVFDQKDRIKQAYGCGGRQNANFLLKEKGKEKEKPNYDRSFDETIVFPRKIKKEENYKKYGEATHKTYVAINSFEDKSKPKESNYGRGSLVNRKGEFIQDREEIREQPKSMQIGHHIKTTSDNHKNINTFCSEKKMPVFTPVPSLNKPQTKSKGFFTSHSIQKRQQQNKGDFSCTDINRLSSLNQLQSGSKASRIRPKSSIMTKDRHESTMKNIKKSVRRIEPSEIDMQRFVETRFLKKPEVIML